MVTTTNFIPESVLFIRNLLRDDLTDPISTKRSTTSKFVMTSYPQRPTEYPMVSIRSLGPSNVRRLGARSTLNWVNISLEIRVWARNEKEKDTLTSNVWNVLRTNQFGTDSTETAGLHDFDLTSSVPVDEPGEEGIKSQVNEVNFKFVLGE